MSDNLASEMSSGLWAALAAAVTTAILAWLNVRAERNRRAKYLAVRSVIAIEEFVRSCASTLLPDPLADETGSDVEPRWPDDLVLPADVDWTAIAPRLAFEILSLQAEEVSARDSVMFMLSVADSWQARDTRDQRFGALGIKASQISDRLRKSYGLGRRDVGDWDPVDSLKKRADELAKRERAAQRESRMKDPT